VLQQGQRLRRKLNSHEAAAPKDVATWEPEWPILVAKPKIEDQLSGPSPWYSGQRNCTRAAVPARPAVPSWRPRPASSSGHKSTATGVFRPAVAAAVQSRGPQGSPARSGRHRGRVAGTRVPPPNPSARSAVVGCCLTPRSTGRATAGHLGPVGGTRYIFANRAKASCLRTPVTSNVRPQNNPPEPARENSHPHHRSLAPASSER